ncbi:MAG: OsmC family protein [Acidobacteria bacterium]|nr:OsmC family protein [Acidobacteriota bacterium]
MAIRIELTQSGPTTTEAAIRSHRTLIDRPEAKGGADLGPMGGELLLASLGGCFASNLFAAAKAREVSLEGVVITVEGELGEAPQRFASVAMRVSGGGVDRDHLDKLVTIADRACIVANTLRNAVALTVLVS